MIAQLDGLELPARAWERDVLPARLERYESSMLDTLCLSGEVGWARLSSGPTQVVGATPIALFLRAHADEWRAVRGAGVEDPPSLQRRPTAEAVAEETASIALGDAARRVLDHLHTHGASFVQEMNVACDLSHDGCREALAELVAAGLVTSDGFAGVRAIVSPAPARRGGADTAGRWSVLRMSAGVSYDDAVRTLAWTLLGRYGVVFRRLLARESAASPGATWRASIASSRRAARFAAADSCPACRASSTRCRTPSIGCASFAARDPTTR